MNKDCTTCRFSSQSTTSEPCNRCQYDPYNKSFSHWQATEAVLADYIARLNDDRYTLLGKGALDDAAPVDNIGNEIGNGDANGTGKQTNPKDALGSKRLPLDLVPMTAVAHQALAHLEGACKYGKWNWRIAGVRASIYVGAALRHIERWNNGEDFDADSGVHNLGHAMACLAILLDAREVGKLNDDRPPSLSFVNGWQEAFNAEAARIIERHADKNPRHFTIEDSQ